MEFSEAIAQLELVKPNLLDKDWNGLRYWWNCLGYDGEAEGAEIFVENQRGDIIEERGYDYE